jgi:hypothetical protein
MFPPDGASLNATPVGARSAVDCLRTSDRKAEKCPLSDVPEDLLRVAFGSELPGKDASRVAKRSSFANLTERLLDPK